MKTTRIWAFGCVLLLSSVSTGFTWAASETNTSRTNTYTNATLGIQFQYPDRFVMGRYHPEPEFARAIVLVEPRILGEIKPDDIPVGELSTISLTVQEGEDAEFTKDELCRPEFKTKIGSFVVYKLPGYPGPYGDEAFCYYVVIPNKKVLEAVAHRFYFDETTIETTNRPQTHYDVVIEGIIRSLRTVKK